APTPALTGLPVDAGPLAGEWATIQGELNSNHIKFASIEPSHRNEITGLQPLMATHRIATSEIFTLSPPLLSHSAIEWITNNNRGCRRRQNGHGVQPDGVNLYLN
ncbi:MAG: hypothetical protein ACRCUF_11980, partial [Aeromonas sobria]